MPTLVTGGLTISKSLGSILSVFDRTVSGFVRSTFTTPDGAFTSVGVSVEKVFATFALFNLLCNSALSFEFNSDVYVPKDIPVPKTLLIDVPDLARASSNAGSFFK